MSLEQEILALKCVGFAGWLHLAVCPKVENLNAEGMTLQIGNDVFRLRATFCSDYEDADLLGRGSRWQPRVRRPTRSA